MVFIRQYVGLIQGENAEIILARSKCSFRESPISYCVNRVIHCRLGPERCLGAIEGWQTDTEKDRDGTERQTNSDWETKSGRENSWKKERGRDEVREREGERGRDTERQRQTLSQTETDRQKHRQRQTGRKADNYRERDIHIISPVLAELIVKPFFKSKSTPPHPHPYPPTPPPTTNNNKKKVIQRLQHVKHNKE